MDKEFKNGKTLIDSDYIDMVITNFNESIEKNLNFVYLGYEILNDNDLKEYMIKREEWKKTLEVFLESAIDLEEYEQCILLKKLIDSLD